MYQMITDEARDRVLKEAMEAHNVYITYARMDNEPFYIFGSWSDVEKLAQIAMGKITVEDIAPGYTWADFEEARQSESNRIWRIEWLLGEFGFEDQFRPCDHCNEAIDLHAIYVSYWLHQDLGDLLCANCIHTNADFQEEYLDYCALSGAYSYRDHWRMEIADRSFADPFLHGWIPLGWDKQVEAFPDNTPHADFDDRLTYASDEELARLYRAADLIDDNIRLLVQHGRYHGQYVIWGKFNPYMDNEEALNDRRIFDYAMGRVFAKYAQLRNKAQNVQLVKSAR